MDLNARFSQIIEFVVCSAMHFVYYINRLIATKVDSTYLGIQWHQDH